MNTILMSFSAIAVSVYGICSRVQGVVTVGIHGINNGLIPIVAYNLGAGNRRRITDSIKWSYIFGIVMFVPFFLLLEIAPEVVLHFFDASEQLLIVGAYALRVFSVSWFVSVLCLVFAAVFQALGQGGYSMWLTLLRQVALPLLLILVLQVFADVNLIWYAFIIAEVITIPVALLLWRKSRRVLPEG